MSSKLTPEKLQQITLKIFEEHRLRSEYARRSDKNVQKLFTRSYNTRYFLELVQNARDAIVDGNVGIGKVKSWIEDDALYFANNGKEFNEVGVNSLCYPAVSQKESREFIGHKGIGFNAVVEISSCPEVITNFGTFFFSTVEASKLTGFLSEDMSLFQYPMFKSYTIVDLDPLLKEEGYTTVFKFPLRDEFKIKLNQIRNNKLSSTDLVFLSAIQEMSLFDERILLKNDLSSVEVVKNDNTEYFRKYNSEIIIAENDVSKFDEDEQAMFKESCIAECQFLLKETQEKRFLRNSSSRMHLFYAMEFSTGFSFDIHSLFSVTLDRKRLAGGSKLNPLLFIGIADFYCSDFLENIKNDYPDQVMDILCYKRIDNNNLENLYDRISRLLKNSEFIYHEPSKKFCQPREIALVSNDEYQIFRDGFLGEDTKLLVVDDYTIKNWLMTECGVCELSNNKILLNIEQKCADYKNDLAFFDGLYRLLVNRKIDARGKNVLLTEHGVLVNGRETEVYCQIDTALTAPGILDKSVSFLHGSISSPKRRMADAYSYLYIREYSQQSLITIAIKLLDNRDIENVDDQKAVIELLHFLVQFEIESISDIRAITRLVHLPVRNLLNGEQFWSAPLYSPVYFDHFVFARDYDNDIFVIDWGRLDVKPLEKEKWFSFLLKIGVWEIPAAYIVSDPETVSGDPKIKFDRELHFPKAITPEFSDVIISNWENYRSFILDNYYGSLTIDDKNVNADSKIKASSLFRILNESEWLFAKHKKVISEYALDKIFFMNKPDSMKSFNQVIMNYFPVKELDESLHREFISDFELKHLNYKDASNYLNILTFTAETYHDLTILDDTQNFEKCYHRLLLFITEYFHGAPSRFSESNYKKVLFLARHVKTQEYNWVPGENCLLIDEKILLEKLIEQDLIQFLEIPYSFNSLIH